jgi:hypothetical protein
MSIFSIFIRLSGYAGAKRPRKGSAACMPSLRRLVVLTPQQRVQPHHAFCSLPELPDLFGLSLVLGLDALLQRFHELGAHDSQTLAEQHDKLQ